MCDAVREALADCDATAPSADALQAMMHLVLEYMIELDPSHWDR